MPPAAVAVSPATHAPPAMHAPLPHMPPCHACPLAVHAPLMDRQTPVKTLPSQTSFADGK